MKNFIKGLLIASAMLMGSAASATTLMSWNTMRMGHSGEKSYPALAAVARNADLLAVQEVMTEDALQNLETALEKATGESWSHLASHAVGSKAYKELYGFLMRDSAVAYEDGAVVYMDRGDRFIREPFSARFKSKRDGSVFALAQIHVLYGKGPEDRAPEVRELANYWTWLEEIYPGTPVMLVGDFNTPPSDQSFADLSKYAAPLITRGASTLSAKDGYYASLYDNIWVSRRNKLPISAAGIIDYPRMIGWSHEKSRKHVSDHAPVIAVLGKDQLPGGIVLVRPEAAKQQSSKPFGLPNIFQGQTKPTESIASNAGSQGGNVRGNANSHVFHLPGCPSYDKISAKNIVEFSSPQAAEAAGYKLAGNCRNK
ncbi:endonuclease/exonuclease/phosphatase family protein [Pseudomonas nitroreducens]|uniref:endonuclease/exonuclease/phosphatase family protein n=1 Tax=Pseudomonas nitroreducens TaxID=46680 RepID=UPI00351CF856